MQHFQLESLAYQTDAVEAVVGVFAGTAKALVQDRQINVNTGSLA